jgi:hypothetical protein
MELDRAMRCDWVCYVLAEIAGLAVAVLASKALDLSGVATFALWIVAGKMFSLGVGSWVKRGHPLTRRH